MPDPASIKLIADYGALLVIGALALVWFGRLAGASTGELASAPERADKATDALIQYLTVNAGQEAAEFRNAVKTFAAQNERAERNAVDRHADAMRHQERIAALLASAIEEIRQLECRHPHPPLPTPPGIS